jgi:hypothetical protein
MSKSSARLVSTVGGRFVRADRHRHFTVPQHSPVTMGPMTSPARAHRINVRCDSGEVTITIDGEVGPDAAELLDQAAHAALETDGVHQVAVDLRKVEHWTTDGFRALTRCAARHPNVRFRFGADVSALVDDPAIPAA